MLSCLEINFLNFFCMRYKWGNKLQDILKKEYSFSETIYSWPNIKYIVKDN